MSVDSIACARKFSRLGNASHLMRRTTLARLAWLAIGLFLPMRGFAGELHFTVVQVESLQPFQPYDGFQLATLAQTPAVNIRVNRLTDRITRHTHPNSHHCLYFITGQVELSLGADTRVVSGGILSPFHGASHMRCIALGSRRLSFSTWLPRQTSTM
jgi:hypothetical protein